MQNLIDFFHAHFGNHRDAAAFLGYSVRQYYNLRQKIEGGQSLNPRIESHLRYKALLLRKHLQRPVGA